MRNAARTWAYCQMSTAASRMIEARYRGDYVRVADLRASMNDLRAMLCITSGVPMYQIDRNGFRHRFWTEGNSSV